MRFLAMRAFRDRPIKQKLLIMIMVATSTALLLAGAGIITFDSVEFQRYLERDLSTLARIIGDNSQGALAFNDPRSAGEMLGALRARTHMVAACTYRQDGSLLASYSRPGAPSGCPPAESQETLRWSRTDLVVSHPILLGTRRYGTVVFLYDLGEISERMTLYGTTVIGVLLVSSLIALLLSSRMRAIIATPIAQLARATTSVSETGDYSIRAQKLSGDELGVLVDRFNEMLAGIQSRDDTLTKALQGREEALREAEKARERFRFMAESMPQKIFTAAPSGEVDYFNRQWMEFTGLSFDQIRDWGWTQFIHPDDLEANLRIWRQSLSTGEPFVFEHRFRRFDGTYRWHLSRVRAMRDAHGAISMWIGSNTEIHEQKEKEEDLRRANYDLEQFAYSASHDLQEPIRNVAIYSEIISKRYHDLLDADGQQFLGFLTEGSRRLARLIHDLLAYTKAGVVEGNPELLDTESVLKHTLSSLAEALRENDATVTYDPLPRLYMGEAHLQQVFQNLISNALKYRTEAPPRIHISAVAYGTGWRFSIQDNGIGIDPQYKEKIFGVFKRLHHDQKYSGTGIGLAICQRVVERYGGRIWVESATGQGATFFFTLPQHVIKTPAEKVESAIG